MPLKTCGSVGNSVARFSDTATWTLCFELLHFSLYVIPLGDVLRNSLGVA